MATAMIAIALLLDGAMYLQHAEAQHSGNPQETVSLVADNGDAPAALR